MMAVGARFSRAVNRVFARRGPVVDGRYHLHVLETPHEVRNALAYVLLNARRHWKKRRGVAPEVKLDEASSGCWFDGWRVDPPHRGARGSPEVAKPHTWLLTRGWRRHRLIDPAEVPGV
jgi:hypothetical protein